MPRDLTTVSPVTQAVCNQEATSAVSEPPSRGPYITAAAAMAQSLFDQAMDAAQSVTYVVLPAAVRGSRQAEDLDDAIGLKEFVAEALRKPDGIRTTWALFDWQVDVPESGWQSIAEHVAEGRHGSLPMEIAPAGDVPSGTKLNCMDVLKMYLFDKQVNLRDVLALVRGRPYVPVHRNGPWSVNKTVQILLNRIPGKFVSWSGVRTAADGRQRREKERWNPPSEELAAGVAYVNKYCPEDDFLNEQFEWILNSIRPGSNAPVMGWPESKVRLMARPEAAREPSPTTFSHCSSAT